MKFAAFLYVVLVVLILSSVSFSQDPLPVTRSSWQATVKKVQKADLPPTGPAKQIIVDWGLDY